jgi:hypothetical protein
MSAPTSEPPRNDLAWLNARAGTWDRYPPDDPEPGRPADWRAWREGQHPRGATAPDREAIDAVLRRVN